METKKTERAKEFLAIRIFIPTLGAHKGRPLL